MEEQPFLQEQLEKLNTVPKEKKNLFEGSESHHGN